MQIIPFSTGGYVIHKLYVNGVKYSVWYREDGTPHSAERVRSNGQTYNVPVGHVHLWAEFKKIGKQG